MTISLEEADQIIELAEKHHIKICMAHPARYSQAFRTMKKMVEAGEIGTPLTIYSRGKCDHRGGGEDLIVLGTHILDLQTFFFGAPESVFADVTTDGKPVIKTDRSQTVEPLGSVAGDEIFAYFRFPDNIIGTFESRKNLFNWENKTVHMGITITGTKGSLSMRFNDNVPVESKLRISRIPAPPEDNTCYEEVELVEPRTIPGAEPLDYSLCGKLGIPSKPFFLESNHFAAWDLIQSIQEDRLPESNQYNARLAQEMIYGIYASHLSGQKVTYPLISRIHPLDD
jgi:predicted dehydrogenase